MDNFTCGVTVVRKITSSCRLGYFSPTSGTLSDKQTSSGEQVVRNNSPKMGVFELIWNTPAPTLKYHYIKYQYSNKIPIGIP